MQFSQFSVNFYLFQESSSPNLLPHAQSQSSSKLENPPASILKPGVVSNHNHQPPQPPEPVAAPPPPERGSSFAVMSMRAKENTKRVSFDTSSAAAQPPTILQLDESIREDPNVCLFYTRFWKRY